MAFHTLHGKSMFKVVETFSGIGAQAKALSRVGIDHEIVYTCDWDINAIIAYCRIHNGEIDVKRYASVSDDEIKTGEAEVQKITDAYILKVDKLSEAKEKDIMTV